MYMYICQEVIIHHIQYMHEHEHVHVYTIIIIIILSPSLPSFFPAHFSDFTCSNLSIITCMYYSILSLLPTLSSFLPLSNVQSELSSFVKYIHVHIH